jgi:circadian clock protein KaiC
LDNRISNQIASRRLRIIKMRGSSHGINEYPFVIDKDGISVLPIISELKSPKLSTNRISSGIDEFDNMLDGKGFFEGSSILVSGSAGTGKTSLAVSLLNSTCKREKRCLYCAFEESSAQIARNMYSIGINLDPFIKSGILEFYCSRPTLKNLELHLIAIHKIIDNFKPEVIIMDPVTNLMSEGINSEIRQMLTHFTDYLRSKNITAVFTAAITLESIKTNSSDEGISAMMDTWVLLSDIEKNSECNRGIHILKSRGMNHSTQVREFKITNNGINILPTFIGSEGILTGSAKLEYILQQEEHRIVREKKFKTEEEEIERKRKVMHEKIALLMLSLESEIDTLNLIKSEDKLLQQVNKESKTKIINSRNQFEGPVQY